VSRGRRERGSNSGVYKIAQHRAATAGSPVDDSAVAAGLSTQVTPTSVLLVQRDLGLLAQLTAAFAAMSLECVAWERLGEAREWFQTTGSQVWGAVLELESSDDCQDLANELLRNVPAALVVVLAEHPTGMLCVSLRRRGITCLPTPIDAAQLAELFCSHWHAWAGDDSGAIEGAVSSYSRVRMLSKTQAQVLQCHLQGMSDKEIALTLLRTETTIYEHWRRMATKANTRYKSGVVTDFYRFLVRRQVRQGRSEDGPGFQDCATRAADTRSGRGVS
jgi:DNA-binding NarL/FixJ family response regulator